MRNACVKRPRDNQITRGIFCVQKTGKKQGKKGIGRWVWLDRLNHSFWQQQQHPRTRTLVRQGDRKKSCSDGVMVSARCEPARDVQVAEHVKGHAVDVDALL